MTSGSGIPGSSNIVTPLHVASPSLNVSPDTDIKNMTTVLEKENKVGASGTMKMVAKRVSASQESLDKCGARLRQGELVSFPTETVYGLGCHALDESAIKKVFAAKERPYSDPLIVHVCSIEDALPLWDASSSAKKEVLITLMKYFWPGPLTIVSRAAPSALPDAKNSNKDNGDGDEELSVVPSLIMAHTGYVAIRSPSHPIARALLKAAKVPVAAPSANKFGHVSPTRPDHVLEDLGMEDVWVIDPSLVETNGDNAAVVAAESDSAVRVCNVGVESTVIKVEDDNANGVEQSSLSIHILRHGAISQRDIESCLASGEMLNVPVVDSKREQQQQNETSSSSQPSSQEAVNHVAPGQEIRHYSPNVPSFMLDAGFCQSLANDVPQQQSLLLSTAVILDFGAQLTALQASSCLAYKDLSPSGSGIEGAANVFDYLRWAESVPNATKVYFPQIVVPPSCKVNGDGNKKDNDNDVGLLLALKDRLTRAASGVVMSSFNHDK